jgi:hypothetical protein
MNHEIDDEIQTLLVVIRQRRFGGKGSITPSRTIRRRENVVRSVLKHIEIVQRPFVDPGTNETTLRFRDRFRSNRAAEL